MYSTFPVSSHISAYCRLRPLELERLLLSERRVNISGRITAHVAPNTSHRHSSASALLRCYHPLCRDPHPERVECRPCLQSSDRHGPSVAALPGASSALSPGHIPGGFLCLLSDMKEPASRRLTTTLISAHFTTRYAPYPWFRPCKLTTPPISAHSPCSF